MNSENPGFVGIQKSDSFPLEIGDFLHLRVEVPHVQML